MVKMQIQRLVIIAALGLILFFSAGCTPAQKNVDQAQQMVDQARDAHADYLAPYHFTRAELFLAEARRQFEQSDFATAGKYADSALEAAREAYRISVDKHSTGKEQAH